MVSIFCCYDLKCKKSPKYWVRRKDKTLPNWWYPLCQEHLKTIMQDSEIEITGLKTERVRKFEHKIFCARDLAIKDNKNWSMFIDWEDIINNLDIDKPITFEVHRALQKHYYNNYLKIKKRIIMSKSNIRYRCDNPKCTSGIKGGGFFIKEGPCPYCGSIAYHSFNASIKDLKRVIDDLIK